VFETPTYDFGTVDSGVAVKHDFIFTNTGDQLLEIREVRPGCGCTTAGAWDKQVEPGKTGKISIEFHSNNYGGAVTKAVTVTCNDSTQESVQIQLRGNVWKAFNLTPATYIMFNLSPESAGAQTNVVKITSNLNGPVTVSNATCSNPVFKLDLKTISEGREFELRVALLEPFPTNGINATIFMSTSSTNTPVISITSYVMVKPVLSTMPSQVVLPQGPLPGEEQFTVTIQNNSTNPLALSEPGINVTNATVKTEELQAGERFNFTMTFPAGFQNKPGHNLEATVKTSNPKYPLVKIPVYQQAPPPPAAASAASQK
jgi:hypothetical protein